MKRLVAQLETEAAKSRLPEQAACREALNGLLVRVRLRHPISKKAERD
jgi:hypothetical protein